MRKNCFLRLTVLATLLCFSTVFAQPAASALLPEETGAFQFIPIEAWVGRGVVFLETNVSLQHYGYQLIQRQPGSFEGVPYSELVGKTGLVTSVSEDFITHNVEITLDDGRTYYAQAFNEGVDGLAFLRDILDAETYYEGETLWIKEPNSEESKIKRFSQVQVLDVKPSQYSSSPVEFDVVDSSGVRDSYYVNMSGTNVGDILFNNARFGDTFYTINPRQSYDWSSQIWDALENSSVFTGMTSEQAVLGWGEPDDINTTTTAYGNSEQWVYEDFNGIPHSYLYFDDGVLSSIQN